LKNPTKQPKNTKKNQPHSTLSHWRVFGGRLLLEKSRYTAPSEPEKQRTGVWVRKLDEVGEAKWRRRACKNLLWGGWVGFWGKKVGGVGGVDDENGGGFGVGGRNRRNSRKRGVWERGKFFPLLKKGAIEVGKRMMEDDRAKQTATK